MDGRDREITRALQDLQAGDADAPRHLLDLVHGELHAMARRQMADQRAGHTLQPTALVNEAWMRIAGAGVSAESRAHFLGVAAMAMRSVLVDHARKRLTDRRGGGATRIPLEDVVASAASTAGEHSMLDLDSALDALGGTHPREARVAEMRLFGEMEHADVGRVLGVSTRTAERIWRTARAELERLLQEQGA